MNWRLVVVGVVEKGDMILLGEKRNGLGPYPNALHNPGGGMNPESESIEEALRREILEEAGIQVMDLEEIGFDEDYEPNKTGEQTHYIYLIFRAKYQSGELLAKSDLVNLRWVKRSELKKLPLNRPSLKLFRKLDYI